MHVLVVLWTVAASGPVDWRWQRRSLSLHQRRRRRRVFSHQKRDLGLTFSTTTSLLVTQTPPTSAQLRILRVNRRRPYVMRLLSQVSWTSSNRLSVKETSTRPRVLAAIGHTNLDQGTGGASGADRNVSLVEKIDVVERGYTADDVHVWMVKIKANGRSALWMMTLLYY